jgi:sigma-B regulation protein RsbU (phosphoserine phosphatase)
MNHPFDTAPCGLFSFDAEGTLIRMNATMCTWLGLDAQEWKGNKVDSLLTLPSRIFYQTHLFPMLDLQKDVTEIFLTLLKKNKEALPVLLSGAKQSEGGATIYTCACITVHHRKQFEDELIAAKRTAEQALQDNSALQQATSELRIRTEKLDEQLALVRQQHAELTQLSRAVTHELQEPLRKISVFSQMLTDRSDSESPTEPARDKLLRATEQMRVVVAGLQQYIWLQETTAKPVLLDIPELLKAVGLQLHERFGNESPELSIGILPEIVADPQQMQLLLFELLSNAIHFKKEGAPARIAISGTEIRKNQYKVLPSNYRYGHFVKLDISDQGTGFDPQYKTAVFGLFSRLHNGQNRGIGLALCKTIVEKHGGMISIHPVPGKGTTVSILLPVLNPYISPGELSGL